MIRAPDASGAEGRGEETTMERTNRSYRMPRPDAYRIPIPAMSDEGLNGDGTVPGDRYVIDSHSGRATEMGQPPRCRHCGNTTRVMLIPEILRFETEPDRHYVYSGAWVCQSIDSCGRA
jgi:hypothetical protein